jgi:hypothetical protein
MLHPHAARDHDKRHEQAAHEKTENEEHATGKTRRPKMTARRSSVQYGPHVLMAYQQREPIVELREWEYSRAMPPDNSKFRELASAAVSPRAEKKLIARGVMRVQSRIAFTTEFKLCKHIE